MAKSSKTKLKNKVTKEVKKEAKAQAKKHPKAVIVIAIILIIAIIAIAVYGYYQGWFDSFLHPQNPIIIQEGENITLQTSFEGEVTWTSSDESIATVVDGVVVAVSSGTVTITASCNGRQETFVITVSKKQAAGTDPEDPGKNPGPSVTNGELSIHFLELGNKYTGDSVYIKAGDTDILIDAGSRQGSAATIGDYIDQYCTDGKLEYVIATHAHQDHIAGFVGTQSAPGIFDRYECENIIQFAKTDATSAVYKNYCEKRDAEVAAGANLYTALECYNNSKEGAQRVYDLTGDGSITMEILYQKFYEEKSSDENNYSVCVLIKQGANNYLFTGDLEEKGEESLVESNPNLPEVVLFKGGHHGSYTASNEVLLNKIKPQYVCVCCCAGSTEYSKNPARTFPAQEFIDRVSKYTDRVYVTTLGQSYNASTNEWVEEGYTSFNGNIVFSCDKGEIKLTCSNNNTKLKDTDWFKANRDIPIYWQDGTTTPSLHHD